MSPAHTEYSKNCMVPKEGHLGQFPANFCVKMIGTAGTEEEENTDDDNKNLTDIQLKLGKL